MSKLLHLTQVASRRLLRMAWRLSALVLAFCLTIAFGFTLYAVSTLPPLQPWHTQRLHEEFTALQNPGLDFAGYQQLESRLFEEMRARQASWDQASESYLYSRFNPASPVNRLAEGAPFNRSFRWTLAKPAGHALLVQGLTDSPYSMKALAESLYSRGFEVTVLRLPGHGTFPSMMTEMHLRDWTAAVRLAARDVAARTPAGKPFYVGGYSTGGTLALQYALDALDDPSLRRPDRVLLVSPAIRLVKVAALAGILDIFSIVPLPVLEKVRWQGVEPEFDPYKFNSFPVNAARQVNRATRALQSALADAVESGRIAGMPPVVTWQSVVDSTVGAGGTAETLYPALQGSQHRLVLFDVNRHRGLGSVQRPAARALIDRLRNGARRYTLDIVSSTDRESRRVSVLRLTPAGLESARDAGLDWPANLVSLGHVAMPFPSDDPVYGFVPGSGRDGLPSIGSLLLRGENGAITISLGALTRLRSNPFWSLIDQDVGELVAADTQVRSSSATLTPP